MNKLTLIIIVCGIALTMSLTPSCTADVIEPTMMGCETSSATYNTNVKPIIDLSCAYSGCHNGGGAAPGNYSSYDGLQSIIQNGNFVNRVIDQQANPSVGMPPNKDIYPASQQDDLSADQMEIIQCWIDSGFGE